VTVPSPTPPTAPSDVYVGEVLAQFIKPAPAPNEYADVEAALDALGIPRMATVGEVAAAFAVKAADETDQLRRLAIEALDMLMAIAHEAYGTDLYDLPYRVDQLRRLLKAVTP
jgi:hypothetical protein